MNKSNNLLIITSAFPNNLNSYEGIFVREQLLFLKEHFDNIYVIRPQYYINDKIDFLNILPKTWKEKPERKNYEIDNIKVFFPIVSIFQPFKNWQIKKFIEKNNLKFDIIHSHFIYPSGEIGNYLKKEFNVKHVCTAHRFDIYDLPFRNKFWNFKIKKILSYIDKVITVSKFNITLLDKLWVWIEKRILIRNWYNSDKFYLLNNNKKDLRNKLWIPINKKVLINVWNLVPQKNQLYLINEFSKLSEDYFLIIIWKGDLVKILKNEINKLKIKSRVILLWEVENNKLINYFNLSDLFIFPSISESTWLAAIEAWACWLSVITYKNWWTEDYITNEVWFVLEKKDSFYKYINKSLSVKYSREIIWNFHKKYSLKYSVKKILNLYSKYL